MAMKWQDHLLPGDMFTTAQEIDAAGGSLQRAIVHLTNAIQHHNHGNYEQSRSLVNMAVDRLEDWEKSDDEMLAAFERHLVEVRKAQRLKLVEELQRYGVEATIVTFNRSKAL